MTKTEKNEEWNRSKSFWICILIEFILITGIFLYHQMVKFPEDFTGIGGYITHILICAAFFCVLLYPFGFMIFSTKTGSIITILLTIFIGIVLPIYEEYKDEKWQCYDRTTYDNNRNNDVKCINKHGESKVMTYKEAREIAPNGFSGWLQSDSKILSEKYTKEIYSLVNERMYDKNGNCVKPYNIFSKDRDAYYGYELLDKIARLEQEGIEFDTDLDDWPHSLDFRFGVRYRAEAKMGYLGCLDGCGLISDSKEYKHCLFPQFY